MGKLIGVLVVLLAVAGVAWFMMNSGGPGSEADAKANADSGVRVEEKYGFTSGGLGG